VDLVKECVQSAANGATWSPLAYRPSADVPSTALTATSGTKEAAATRPTESTSWLRRSFYNPTGTATEPRAVKKLRRALFKPTAKSATDAQSNTVTDIDQLKLTGNTLKAPQHANRTGAPVPDETEEDIYVDTRSGTTDLGPEKLIEVKEAVVFMWAGLSPFWSPLMLRKALLEPLRELVYNGTPDKVSAVWYTFWGCSRYWFSPRVVYRATLLHGTEEAVTSVVVGGGVRGYRGSKGQPGAVRGSALPGRRQFRAEL
jgi:hypothetical protein